ncbi:HAD-IA family hydrolase [Vitreoscilla massiliensis]|uniref:HAD-IA family hydrolase n=1 Tax=Vitreoscilla massiliensis TaxID=1689272 RepID=A0ABY4E0V2_9NEIS|nr:HAD-IA family hydrolase [Vitreoscilla massiliensis]UOO89371.1 HAD-IA family hydrolase [Vitreoscilla massiliensis]
MSIKAVLFDLDGTLADTALDLGGALNTMLREHGLPAVSMDEIRPVASHGASGLLKLGMNLDKSDPNHARLRQQYLDTYETCFDQDTVLFDGIDALIQAIHARGLKWGIITNKPHTFTHRLVPQLGFSVAPDVVVSGDTTAEAKPSTKPMLYACEQIDVAPEACLYVGDAERDMQAGKNAGMHTVLVSWGYIHADDNIAAWPADTVIDTPEQLLQLL